MARDWTAAWEAAAAELGLGIVEWTHGKTAKPIRMTGTVDGFDVTIATWVETSSEEGGARVTYAGGFKKMAWSTRGRRIGAYRQ